MRTSREAPGPSPMQTAGQPSPCQAPRGVAADELTGRLPVANAASRVRRARLSAGAGPAAKPSLRGRPAVLFSADQWSMVSALPEIIRLSDRIALDTRGSDLASWGTILSVWPPLVATLA